MYDDSGSRKLTAMVLCAGYGNRLKPLTDSIPKALVPLLGRPLVENIIINLQKAGIKDIAVNAHYLGEKIDEYFANPDSPVQAKVTVFHEQELLDNGGALVNAREVLADADCFVLHNCDVLTDLSIPDLIRYHCSRTAIATLAVVNGTNNNVLVCNDEILNMRNKLKVGTLFGAQLLTYTGVAVFSRAIFNYLPEYPRKRCIIEALLDIIQAKPGAVRAYVTDAYWTDVGSPEKYLQAHDDILFQKIFTLPDWRYPGYAQ